MVLYIREGKVVAETGTDWTSRGVAMRTPAAGSGYEVP